MRRSVAPVSEGSIAGAPVDSEANRPPPQGFGPATPGAAPGNSGRSVNTGCQDGQDEVGFMTGTRTSGDGAEREQEAALLALAVSQSPTVVFVAERGDDLPVSFISANVTAATGHPARAFTEDPGFRLRQLQAGDRAAYRRALAALEVEGAVVQEYRFRCASGEYRWFREELRLAPPDDAGRRAVVGSMTGLHEAGHADWGPAAALQDGGRLSRLLEDAIESLPEAFSLFDAEDRLILCNSRFREFNALSADVLVPGVRWLDFIRVGAERGQYVEAQGRVEDWLADREHYHSLGTGDRRGVEFQQHDGRWYYGFSQLTRQGGYVGIRVDITERKRMELALRESEELVHRVLEACPVPITMSRFADGGGIYASPSARALLELGRDGAPWSDVRLWARPEARATYLEQLRRHGKVDSLETRYRKTGGATFDCALSSRVIDYRGEQVVVSNLFDLTERKAAEAELARQREMLHQSEKLSALGELLAGVSHELNNPLSVLVGQAMMLQETARDAETASRAEKIGKAADRCARIVRAFLAMARQEPRAKVPVDLNEVVRSALEVAGYTLRTSGIEVSQRLAKDLPKVMADPDQMRQVLTNLVVNARDALQDLDRPRLLRITTSFRRATCQVVVKVKDNGEGIPAEIQSRIFEPLYTTKEVGTGTGIGLALCHRIVESHGGAIVVEPAPGQGAIFAIRLPCSKDAETVRPPPPPRRRKQASYRVLVVDDEYDVGRIISDVLSHEGHQVDVAQAGSLALEMIERQGYDVVLSDVRMPEMDGPSFYRHLLETNPRQVEGLAFITGDTLSPRVREFLNQARRPHLEKPLLPRDIRDLVHRLMRERST